MSDPMEIVRAIATLPEDARYRYVGTYDGAEKTCIFCDADEPRVHPHWRVRYEGHEDDCLYVRCRDLAGLPRPPGFPRSQQIVDAQYDCEVREAYGSVVVICPEMEMSGIGDDLKQACEKLGRRLNVKEYGKDAYGNPKRPSPASPIWFVWHNEGKPYAKKYHEELIPEAEALCV